jgi:hypothetical protein
LNKNNLEELVLARASEKETGLSELVNQLSGELNLRRSTVARGVGKLLDEDKIRIVENKVYSSLASYILSPFSFWFWGAVVPTVASLGLVFFTSGFALYLRYVFASLLVVLLPGYSLAEALYPKKELDKPTRLVVSIGLSLALVPLVGLVLNFTPFGVRLLPVVFSLSGLTFLLLLIALGKKHAFYKLSRSVA